MLGAPAPGAALEDVTVVEEAVEHGGDGSCVAEELAPVIDRAVGGEKGAGPFVPAHHEFEEILCRRRRELAHAEVVHGQQRGGGEGEHLLLAGASDGGVSKLLKKDMRLAVKDPVALLDGGSADGLCEVTFACSRRSQEKSVFVFDHEVASGEVVYQAPIHLLVKVEVEAVKGTVPFAKASGFETPLEQAIGADSELVGDETGNQIEMRELLGLRLAYPDLDSGGHSAEAELSESTVYFDEIHSGSLVRWLMYER
jgi:hypothetical protein